ncbi:hypothetical protein [Gordonia insulae]|uniref:Uncharacterized protein n=1 Tax=Gordonia insulae TaxID=2420509 RepID=A0A3G8JEP8_9ACTN|nr:hypothetical protein [Gordonia insulae]AZG43464.1 hypothetical protein D7316_00028 [Gordonia insulae]
MATHVCPDCGASHRQKAAPKRPATPKSDHTTDLDPVACPRCRATVLAARIGGLPRQLDPRPLNEIGWRTYAGIGRRIYIRVGVRADIASATHRWPPVARSWAHIEHDCDRPTPDALVENNVTEKTRTTEFPDTPDF